MQQATQQKKRFDHKPHQKDNQQNSITQKLPLPEIKPQEVVKEVNISTKAKKITPSSKKKLTYQQLFYITFGASIVFIIFFSFLVTKLYSRYYTPLVQPTETTPTPRELVYLFQDSAKFADDFSITTLRDEAANWSISGNALQQISDGKNADTKGSYAIMNTAPWNSFSLKILVKSDKDGSLGIITNYDEKTKSFYRISLTKTIPVGGPSFIIEKCVESRCTQLKRNAFDYTPSRVHTIEVHQNNGLITTQIDGSHTLTAKDESPLAAGKIGFFSAGQGSVYFAQLKIIDSPMPYINSPFNPLLKEPQP